MKVEISKEDLDFVRNLAHELATQSNRATGKPYYYTIRKKKRVVGMDASYSSETVMVDTCSGDYQEFPDEEAAIVAEMKEQEISREEAEKYVDKTYEEFGVYEYEEDQNVFLTYKGLLEHIRLNGHNIGRRIDPDKPWVEDDQIHSYVHHAFRNPEMRRLIEIIEKLGTADATE